MKFPVIELVDRYAIAEVKNNLTSGANAEELKFYQGQMKNAGIDTQLDLILELVRHHRYVWSLEDDFKKARIDNLPLEEIGRRALHIRDLGVKRAEIKNKLAEMFDDPVREVKQDHLSESKNLNFTVNM